MLTVSLVVALVRQRYSQYIRRWWTRDCPICRMHHAMYKWIILYLIMEIISKKFQKTDYNFLYFCVLNLKHQIDLSIN